MIRRTLRSRLLVSFIIVASGVLLFASLATWLLVRGSAQRIARDELDEKASRLQDLTADLNAAIDDATNSSGNDSVGENARLLQNGLVQIARGLQVTDARLVFVARSDGEILTGDEMERISNSLSRRDPELVELIALPEGVAESDLDPEALLAGAAIEGSHGTLVYRAEILTGRGAQLANVPVLVLTQRADVEAQRRVLTTFLFAAAVALALCAGVSAWLARRLTRPLGAVSATAAAIAGGDLSARVAPDAHAEAELATLTATINQMAADLEQARGAERAFLMSITHDLRTPLTSIRGYAEALADGTLDAADAAARIRAAQVISSEARRLERLVRDLLDLSRLDRREFSLHPRRCDAATVVREAALAFAPQAGELGLTIDVDTPLAITADLDAERLGQIVANLTENALKFAVSRVHVGAVAVGSTVVVSVLDDGQGIPTEEQHGVFDRLHTVRSSPGRAVGTGLGLAIVSELAQAMGGDARVETPSAGGTRFVVRVSNPA